MADSVKKFEPLPLPRGEGGPFFMAGIVDVGGHPYAVFTEKVADVRNNWVSLLHLVPFEEVKP